MLRRTQSDASDNDVTGFDVSPEDAAPSGRLKVDRQKLERMLSDFDADTESEEFEPIDHFSDMHEPVVADEVGYRHLTKLLTRKLLVLEELFVLL